MKILIIGTGMYVSGRNTEGYGIKSVINFLNGIKKNRSSSKFFEINSASFEDGLYQLPY